MKYKVGDKVLIRRDLICGQRYYNENSQVFDIMTHYKTLFCGKVVTIGAIDERFQKYYIKENPHMFSWTDGMFDCKVGCFMR